MENENQAPVDWNPVLQGFDGKLALLKDLVDIFREECPRLLKLLKESVANRDADGIKYAAHTLKGSVRYFGETPVFDQALNIELMATKKEDEVEVDLDGVDEKLLDLEQRIDQFMPSLDSLVEQIDRAVAAAK